MSGDRVVDLVGKRAGLEGHGSRQTGAAPRRGSGGRHRPESDTAILLSDLLNLEVPAWQPTRRLGCSPRLQPRVPYPEVLHARSHPMRQLQSPSVVIRVAMPQHSASSASDSRERVIS